MNAKDEFIEHVGTDRVLCATIGYTPSTLSSATVERSLQLNIGFTPEDMDEFLSKMDFEYDNGYGGQELFGTIWYVEGSFSSRGEYDGSEWWEAHRTPTIPEELYVGNGFIYKETPHEPYSWATDDDEDGEDES